MEQHSAAGQAATLARRSNLPTPPTPLIGRARARESVAAQLRRPEIRLLTLTGAGGVGKTRLAIAVAGALAEDRSAGSGQGFADGVAFVDLAPIADPVLVPSAIARALDIGEAAGRPLVESLVEDLRARSLLLVLDNVEQLLDAAPVVAGLLAACPGLKVLATSRAALRLSGEHEYPVPPLDLPDSRLASDPEALGRSEAVALFVQRARAARPEFALTAANAQVIAQLCARLDGLPLAIELAAARIKLLSPQALLARLERRLTVLTGGARDLPARQQTLRSTMDWSYHLLEPAERTLFARLAVFVGGFSLDAGIQVSGFGDTVVQNRERQRADLPAQGSLADARGSDPGAQTRSPEPETLDVLASLVDKSLLRQAEGPEGEPRFTMLETVREYAIERFEAGGDAETWRQGHAELYLALAEQAAPELVGPRQASWLERLEREHDNLRAALTWALDRDQAELGLRLTGALRRFWEVRGHFAEGRGWLERTLSRWPEGPPAARAVALNAAGSLAYHAGEYERAVTLHEQALELQRALGDRRGMAASLHNLGITALNLADLDRSEVLCAEGRALWREVGDDRGVAISLNSSAILARNRGDHERARAYYDESLALFRRIGDSWGVGMVLNNLARVARDLEDWDQVASLSGESLALFQELGDRRGIAWVLSNLIVVAGRRGLWEQAARLHGAAESLREAVGAVSFSLSPAEMGVHEAAVTTARARLGDAAFAEAMAAGRALSPDEIAGATAMAGTAPAATPVPERQTGPLTRRERQVAGLVAQGLTDRQIAESLVITEGTVGVHLNNIFTKLDLHTRAQLAVWAAEHGLR